MRSVTSSLTFVLGLLTSLIDFTTSVSTPHALSVLGTLKEPFTLTARHPHGFHVVVNRDGTPVATVDSRASTVFKLTDGNLTTSNGDYVARRGHVSFPLPPPLIPVTFPKFSLPGGEIPFVAVTHIDEDKKETLNLFTVNARK